MSTVEAFDRDVIDPMWLGSWSDRLQLLSRQLRGATRRKPPREVIGSRTTGRRLFSEREDLSSLTKQPVSLTWPDR
jgi:hypothetical protein